VVPPGAFKTTRMISREGNFSAAEMTPTDNKRFNITIKLNTAIMDPLLLFIRRPPFMKINFFLPETFSRLTMPGSAFAPKNL
jgi:hypothetical protein